MVSSTIVQQDSNTTQATDRTKRDALSFGAKQIAIMTEVGLIAGSLYIAYVDDHAVGAADLPVFPPYHPSDSRITVHTGILERK